MASRDLPKSFHDLFLGWVPSVKNEITIHKLNAQLAEEDYLANGEERVTKFNWKVCWPALISGWGLFSDGYINALIGSVNTVLKILYPKDYAGLNAMSNVSSIAFVGTVIGQLGFGYISDRIDRKGGMLAANIILIVFALLCSCATWGANGSVLGMFAALTVFRFFLGIGIGAEYPTASVIASEFANQLPAGKRNRIFGISTCCAIDFGFVVAAFVPLVCLWIFGMNHLTAVWRLTLGLGVIPPLVLFFFRLGMAELEAFKKFNMKKATFPIWLCIKFYWFRLLVISLLWFLYNFSSYSFGIYSSAILNVIIPNGDLYKTFGWNTVFNLFYMPGCIAGAFAADWFGPRIALTFALLCQGIIGFAMAGSYSTLKHNVAGFTVVFGFFTAFGEFGPGNTMGLISSKMSGTPIRGSFYGIAAAVGKIGAFVGTWVFPVIIKNAGGEDTDQGNRAPFYVSLALCIFSAFVAWFFLPYIGQDAINREDEAFLNYLSENGYDIKQLGYHDDSLDDASDIEKTVEVADSKGVEKPETLPEYNKA